MYRHTQRSRAPLLVMGAFSLLIVGIGLADRVILPLMLVVAALLAWSCWIFRQLTIEIDGGELRAWFGSGWPRYSWPLERIASVRTVRNPFWYGIGIRFTPHGMLYNVASGPGVEFRLKSGATFRLGSDDAEALAAAIQTAAALDPADAERTALAPGPTGALPHSRTTALPFHREHRR